MEVRENFICFRCKHSSPDQFGCKAFPDGFGIPEEILQTNKHNKPLKNQKTNIVYEAREEFGIR